MAPEDTDQLFGKQLVRKLLLPALFGVVVYAGLLFYGDAREVAAGFRQLGFGALLSGILLSLASFGLRGLRWGLYLRRMSIAVPYRESALIFLIGLGMSITPGKLGEVLKSLLLKQQRDIPVARSAPIIIAERVTDLSALLVLGTAGLTWMRFRWAAIAIGVLVLVGFFALGRSQRVGHALVGFVGRLPRIERYREKLSIAHASLYELWDVRTYVSATALSLVAWTLQALIIVVFSRALEYPSVSVLEAQVAYSAPLLAGALSFIPGGLGLTEASMTGALRALSGVSPAGAATLTILIRGTTFWLAIALGLVAFATWRARVETTVVAHADAQSE